MSSYSRYSDRHYSSSSRRDGSQSSRRDKDSSRRSGAGPSRGRSPQPPSKPRDENELPAEFGRPLESTSVEDENTVLKRMKTAFTRSPLALMNQCIQDKIKIKIWTRNFKEVRGICTGYVIAFDKHWNLVLSDVEEVYLKPRKAKTPYLLEVKSGDEEVPELPARVPRVKKPKTSEEETTLKTEAVQKSPEEEAKKRPEEEAPNNISEEESAEKSPKEAAKKPKKNKKKGRKVNKRHLKQLFVRGDNIVMCAVLDEEGGHQTSN